MFLMCFDALFILAWLLIVRAEGIVKRERERERGRFGHRSGCRARSQPHTHARTHTHIHSVSQQASAHIHFNVSLPTAQMDSAMCANCVSPTRISPHSYKRFFHTHRKYTHTHTHTQSC